MLDIIILETVEVAPGITLFQVQTVEYATTAMPSSWQVEITSFVSHS